MSFLSAEQKRVRLELRKSRLKMVLGGWNDGHVVLEMMMIERRFRWK